MVTNINFYKEHLGKVLAEKFITAISGTDRAVKIGKRISHTVFPNGFVLRYKLKHDVKINR